MDEGLEAEATSPAAKSAWHRLRWQLVLVLILLLAAGAWLWSGGAELDPRLIGEWRVAGGSLKRFHADGRFEHVTSAGIPVMLTGPKVWFIEKGELVVSANRSVGGRFRRLERWFRNLFSRKTGVLTVGVSDSRYEIVKVAETTLLLRLIRQPPAPPRAVEVLERAGAKQVRAVGREASDQDEAVGPRR